MLGNTTFLSKLENYVNFARKNSSITGTKNFYMKSKKKLVQDFCNVK